MPFRFKQFTIAQHDVTMKVNTDGVLLGAWAPVEKAKTLLDIGAGTGVIALMMAQRNSTASIDAVEKDAATAEQAAENIANSRWSKRITIHAESIQHFAEHQATRYDVIVSNPPFFTNALSSPVKARTLARHAEELPHGDLIRCAKKLLAPDGRFCVILPVKEGAAFCQIAQDRQLYCTRQTTVYSNKTKQPKRLLLSFSATPAEVLCNEMAIHLPRSNEYTPEYKRLTADFYLHF